MSLTQDQITALNFKKFLNAITPYMGGSGGTEYTAGNGIVIDEDEISTDNMESTDLAEIVTNMPNVQTNLPRYSTEEQKVGYWIDGKPIYQKVINGTFAITSQSTTHYYKQVDPLVSNVGLIIDAKIMIVNTSGNLVCSPLHINNRGSNWMLRTIDADTYDTIIIQYTKTTDTPI